MVGYQMKYQIKLPISMPSAYFWYFYRCIYYLKKNNIAEIEWIENSINQTYVLLIYINDRPIYIDLRDDNKLSNVYKNKLDSLIFKSNYSSELWNNTPDDFPFIFETWERDIQKKIKPFILGRSFNDRMDLNEFDKYRPENDKTTYNIVSFSGSALTNENSLIRLKTYELLSAIPDNNLFFWLRKHGDEISDDVIKKANVFNCHKTQLGLIEFYKFLSNGKYSLNMPGICLSQPFRCVDAVLANRCIISTKIWCDIYKSFPCITLPICGYFGNGD